MQIREVFKKQFRVGQNLGMGDNLITNAKKWVCGGCSNYLNRTLYFKYANLLVLLSFCVETNIWPFYQISLNFQSDQLLIGSGHSCLQWGEHIFFVCSLLIPQEPYETIDIYF